VTFFSAIPVPETQIGIALETVRGTPAEPEFWIPISGPKYKPDLKLLPDEGLRGSMVTIYDEVPGLRYDSHSWDQHPYLDSFPVFLRSLFGSKDNLTAAIAGTPVTTLFAEAKAGDKKIITVATLTEGVSYVIDFGTASAETVVAGKPVKLGVGEWEAPVAALAFKHEPAATVTAPLGELTAEAKAGKSKIKASVKAATGYFVIGVGNTQETVLVTGEKGGELELAYPLAFTHANKAPVLSLTSHAFSLLNNEPAEGNQPVSCTLTDYAGETNWRQLAAAQLDSLTLSGAADALPKAALNWFADSSITPTPLPEAGYSTAEAPPGWTVKAAVGGTQIGYLVSWEFILKRGVKNIPAITGTQNYYQHFAGALEPTAKIVVLEDPAASWLTAYENGELESIDLTLSDVESGFALNLHSTKAKFLTGDLDRSKEWVEVPLEVQLLPSEADALAGGVSPIVATVANARTTAY
jgi:hypothetical protein